MEEGLGPCVVAAVGELSQEEAGLNIIYLLYNIFSHILTIKNTVKTA